MKIGYCPYCQETVDARLDCASDEAVGFQRWTCRECERPIDMASVRNEPFGPEEHDSHGPPHSGKRGHHCAEFDGLWICEDCPEFDLCTCFDDE